MKIRHLAVAALVTAGGYAGPATAAVVVNEVLYRPPTELAADQFIELHNTGTASVEVTGWRLSGGIDVQLPATSIPADGYLVVCADPVRFRVAHPSLATLAGPWSGQLGAGDSLKLHDASGTVVDAVTYATEGEWATRELGSPDHGFTGWEWHAGHNGGGRSLELVNPSLPHTLAFNWASSLTSGGTPGAPNSTATVNAAPLISATGQFPLVPKSTESIFVFARILDEAPAGISAALHWRVDSASPGTFQSTPMLDDGGHGDGAAGDGLYGAVIPPQPSGTILEFYLTASDVQGNTRTAPRVTPAAGRTGNFVTQVDNAPRTNAQPLYRVVMAAVEKAALDAVEGAQPLSDAASSGTWVTEDGTGTALVYTTAFRNRGHGTRSHSPHNIKVELPGDQSWQGRSH